MRFNNDKSSYIIGRLNDWSSKWVQNKSNTVHACTIANVLFAIITMGAYRPVFMSTVIQCKWVHNITAIMHTYGSGYWEDRMTQTKLMFHSCVHDKGRGGQKKKSCFECDIMRNVLISTSLSQSIIWFGIMHKLLCVGVQDNNNLSLLVLTDPRREATIKCVKLNSDLLYVMLCFTAVALSCSEGGEMRFWSGAL